MDRDGNNERNFGGQRRGVGGAWGFPAERDREINLDNLYGYPGSRRNTEPRSDDENLFSWISTRSRGVDGIRNNGRDVTYEISSSSSEPEMRAPESSGHTSVNYVQYGPNQGVLKCNTFASSTGCGFPFAQIASGSNVTVPAHGQGGVGVAPNGNQAGEHNMGVQNNGAAVGVQGSSNNVTFPVQGGLIGTMFMVRRCVYGNPIQNCNQLLVKYITDSLTAFQSRNGDVFGDFLSVRDQHIFQVLALPALDFTAVINMICNNRDLVEVFTAHIDCVKALFSRNIQLAFYRQTACVNAIMRLLHEPHSMGQPWTNSVISTVTYELNVISSKMPPFTPRTGMIMRYSMVVTNTVFVFHPPGCQCHVPKLPEAGNFDGSA